MCYGSVVAKWTIAQEDSYDKPTGKNCQVLAAYEEIRLGGLRYRTGDITYFIMVRVTRTLSEDDGLEVRFSLPFRCHEVRAKIVRRLPEAVRHHMMRTAKAVAKYETEPIGARGAIQGLRRWSNAPFLTAFPTSQTLQEALAELQVEIKSPERCEVLGTDAFQVSGEPTSVEDEAHLLLKKRSGRLLHGEGILVLKAEIEKARGLESHWGEGKSALITYCAPDSDDGVEVQTLMHISHFYVGWKTAILDPHRILTLHSPFGALATRNGVVPLSMQDERASRKDPNRVSRWILRRNTPYGTFGETVFLGMGFGPTQTYEIGWKNYCVRNIFIVGSWLATIGIAVASSFLAACVYGLLVAAQ